MLLSEFFNTPKILLAPMAGVTDMPFRMICKEMGCDLTYTEMVSAKALHFGSKNTRDLLAIGEREVPVAVQIFGSDADIMAQQAQILAQDQRICIIDINMGCPTPKITGNGDGSALMKQPELAARIMRKVSSGIKKPVTVKIRKGWDDESVNAVEFSRRMEQSGAAAVTVHGRTRAQQYSGKADWSIIAAVKQALSVPVIGNGDIFEPQDALNMLERTGCNAVMVARGACGNPWIFSQIAALLSGVDLQPPSMQQRAEMALRHATELVELRGEKAIAQMRKHVAWYIKSGKNCAAVRAQANACGSLAELAFILNEYAASEHNA